MPDARTLRRDRFARICAEFDATTATLLEVRAEMVEDVARTRIVIAASRKLIAITERLLARR